MEGRLDNDHDFRFVLPPRYELQREDAAAVLLSYGCSKRTYPKQRPRDLITFLSSRMAQVLFSFSRTTQCLCEPLPYTETNHATFCAGF